MMQRQLKIGLLRKEEGTVLLESTFTLVILLMSIFAILDMSRALFMDHYVCYSAREAVRYAMVRGATWNNASCSTPSTSSCTATSANIKSFVQSITPIKTTGNDLAVNTTWTGTTPSGASCTSGTATNSPGCVVQVQVVYNFNFVLPFLPKGAMAFTGTSAVAIAQ